MSRLTVHSTSERCASHDDQSRATSTLELGRSDGRNLQNLIQGVLVNGSMGLIIDFKTAWEALKDGARLGVADRAGTSLQQPDSILEAYKQACEEDKRSSDRKSVV